MIPRVRTWRVRLWRNGVAFKEIHIDTINKQFARWLAAEREIRAWSQADKVTVSLKRGPSYLK